MEACKKHSTKVIQDIGKPFALALKQANACLSELDFGRAAVTGPAMLGEYFSDLFSLFFHPWPVCCCSCFSRHSYLRGALFLFAHFGANNLRLKVQNLAESKEGRCVVVPVHQAMNRLPCMPNDLAWNLDDRGLEGSEFHCQ